MAAQVGGKHRLDDDRRKSGELLCLSSLTPPFVDKACANILAPRDLRNDFVRCRYQHQNPGALASQFLGVHPLFDHLYFLLSIAPVEAIRRGARKLGKYVP
jgi:hypothetical protein